MTIAAAAFVGTNPLSALSSHHGVGRYHHPPPFLPSSRKSLFIHQQTTEKKGRGRSSLSSTTFQMMMMMTDGSQDEELFSLLSVPAVPDIDIDIGIGGGGSHMIIAAAPEQAATAMMTTTTAALEQTTAQTTFEAIPPDTSTLLGMISIVVLSIIAGVVWNNEVVPVSRAKLAVSKRNGDVKQYLTELEESAASASVPTTTSSTGVESFVADSATVVAITDRDQTNEDENGNGNEHENITSENQNNDTTNVVDKLNNNNGKNKNGDRAFERWLFTDWLVTKKQQEERKKGGINTGTVGRQKEPALPILKDAKWNSGDNPILVATSLILLGVTITSVTERIF